MKNLLFILLLSIIAFSCRSRPEAIVLQGEVKEKVVERLVPYALPEDSTRLVALLECDSLNQVIIKELSEVKSGKIQSGLSLTGGIFDYSTYHPPDTVYVPAKDSIIYIRDLYPVYVEMPIEVNKLTKLQSFQIRVAWIAEIILLCYLAFGFKWGNIFNKIRNLIKK